MQFKPFILTSLFYGMAIAAFADDQSKTVALSETPVAVWKAIQIQAGEGKLGNIDKVSDGWETVFDVELTANDGQERDFTVADDGTLLRVEVTLAETPVLAQQSVKTLIGDGKLESIDRNLDDSEITYDVRSTATNSQEKDFTIADDGTLLSEKVALNETPDAVQKTIASQLNGGKLGGIDKNCGDAETSYDVEVTAKDGQERSFTVAMGGSLSSVEVTLKEIPSAAQKTIRNKIGDGKILEIDQSFVKKEGVFPYEVQGMKDGKPFDFSVGPHGRFLGMDD